MTPLPVKQSFYRKKSWSNSSEGMDLLVRVRANRQKEQVPIRTSFMQAASRCWLRLKVDLPTSKIWNRSRYSHFKWFNKCEKHSSKVYPTIWFRLIPYNQKLITVCIFASVFISYVFMHILFLPKRFWQIFFPFKNSIIAFISHFLFYMQLEINFVL